MTFSITEVAVIDGVNIEEEEENIRKNDNIEEEIIPPS